MYVNVAVLKEAQPHERRVALVPSLVARYAKAGARLHMQSGAGAATGLPDAAFEGVACLDDIQALLGGADVVLCVQPPPPEAVDLMKEGAVLICFVHEAAQPALVQKLIERKITCFAMETVPRITRAQAMDALSSQAALAGYAGVMLGATHLRRILPKLTSAAGAIGPARVLVLGLGVAGLEAIATAHRLGAVVEGYDVRPDTREQAESLGATFVDTGVDATGEGGYARALSADETARVAQALTAHIARADLVVTTAAIPGRASPRLVSHAQVLAMKPGAVIVDLAAEGGGNCEDTRPGETVEVGAVTIVAPLNVPSLLAEDASELYARNVHTLLAVMLKDNVITLDWDDEILSHCVLTHAGRHRRDASQQDAFPAGPGAAKPAARAA